MVAFWFYYCFKCGWRLRLASVDISVSEGKNKGVGYTAIWSGNTLKHC